MKNIKRNKNIALTLGIILTVFYFYNRINPIQVETLENMAQGQIIATVIYIFIRIFSAVLCSELAVALNRNKYGWGIFGFILPPISLIVISFMKPIYKPSPKNDPNEKHYD